MTDDDTDRCGHDTEAGHPCKRPAGWGTDRDHGFCTTHTRDESESERGTTRPANRPTKLTMQRQENIAAMLERGHSVAAACRCNGIGTSTFYQWLDRGDDQEEGIFADFADRVAHARGVGEADLVDELVETCREKGDTRTMLSIIKSRYPESWGDAEAADEGGTVNIHLSPAESE